MLFLREFWQHRRLFLLNILTTTLALSLLLSVNIFSHHLMSGLDQQMNETGLTVNCLQFSQPRKEKDIVPFIEEFKLSDYVLFHQTEHDRLQIAYGENLDKLFVFTFKKGCFSRNGAVLGYEAWKHYGYPQPGESIEIDGADFKVAGILKKDSANLYLNLDETVILPDCFNPDRRYEKLFFRSEKHYFTGFLNQKYGEAGYLLLQQKALQKSLRSLISLAGNTLLALSLFSVLIALLSLLASALSSLKSRYHEIAIKKALGADERAIYRQFLLESLLVLVISSLLASGISLIIRKMTGAAASAELLQSECFYLVLVNIAGLMISLYPAYRAGKITVIETIRN